MNKKQVLVLSLSALISLGGFANGGVALAEEAKSQDLEVVECVFDNLSFEDFMKDMSTKDIPKNDIKKLESLYDQSIKLEKDNKLDKADKKWDEFYKILDKYLDEDDIVVTLEDLSFEDFMKLMSTKDIPKDDMKKLENLYDQSLELEKDNKLDKADKKWDEFYKILDKYFDEDDIMINLEDLSFEDFMKDMPTKDIPKDDMKKLESLYDQSTKLEKDNKLDKANKKWDEFYKILEKYFDKDDMVITFEDLNFKDFMKDMPTKDIPKDDMKKLENIYDEITKLEKDNKFDEADKKWDEFDKILDKYLDEEDKNSL